MEKHWINGLARATGKANAQHTNKKNTLQHLKGLYNTKKKYIQWNSAHNFVLNVETESSC